MELIIPLLALTVFVIWVVRRAGYSKDDGGTNALSRALPRILEKANPHLHGPVVLAGRADKAKRLFL